MYDDILNYDDDGLSVTGVPYSKLLTTNPTSMPIL